MISKDPERNLLCLIVLVLSLFLPGLLQLCINEKRVIVLFEIIQELKKMISKDPERNLLCLIVLVLSLFLPGLLQLCINEREMFLLLDPIRVS